MFNGFSGSFGPGVTAWASLSVPNEQALIGVSIYHSGVTYDATALTGGMNTIGTLIIP